jgi:myo-inositol-1(or 4)-monophosphatase
MSLNALRDTAETIARGAGALIQDYAAQRRNQAAVKSTSINIVTEADKASEAYITQALQAVYPDHHIYGEEGGGYGQDPASAPFRWYVDPIDGTTSYAHGYPGYAINLAVLDASGEPVVGITYDPNLDECFSAIKGQGAWLNNTRLQVSAVADLVGALVVSGFPYDRHTAANNNTAAWAAFARRTQGLRRSGSAALDMAYVAAGRADGYWERGPEPWDYMAGILMIREAGGRVTDYTGATDGLYTGHEILATNGLLHDAMRDVLAEVEAGFRNGQS